MNRVDRLLERIYRRISWLEPTWHVVKTLVLEWMLPAIAVLVYLAATHWIVAR